MEDTRFEAPAVVEYKGQMGAPTFSNMPQFENMLADAPRTPATPLAPLTPNAPGTQLALADARTRPVKDDDYTRLSEMVLYIDNLVSCMNHLLYTSFYNDFL